MKKLPQSNYIIIIVFLILLLPSCKAILLKIYGIKEPDIENEKTIIKKAQKYKLDTSNIVSVSAENFISMLKGRAIPDCSIYDRNGNYIEYRKTPDACNAGLFEFIPELNLNQNYHKPDSAKLDKILKNFKTLKGEPINALKPADFYLLIYWTVWIGKLNKDHVKIWEKAAKENTNCNIEVIKVNMDVQEYWDKKEQEKIIMEFK